MDVHAWLMEADPALRWQALRDLTEATPEEVARERARVATEGIGAALLARQNPDGGWGVTAPTSYARTPEGSALHALTLLRELGLDPASAPARAALSRVRQHLVHGGWATRFFEGEVEACINGRVLAAAAYFGEDLERILERLLAEQLDDGGWNCDAPPSTRSSFHSTICVLDGLIEVEHAGLATPAVTDARVRAQAYLLERRLLRSRTSGKIIDPGWLRFAYPHGYHYDALRALDQLRRARGTPDPRVGDAIDAVVANRAPDGRWPLQVVHPDCYPCDLGEEQGAPSRWVTLLALRVLRWAGHEPARA